MYVLANESIRKLSKTSFIKHILLNNFNSAFKIIYFNVVCITNVKGISCASSILKSIKYFQIVFFEFGFYIIDNNIYQYVKTYINLKLDDVYLMLFITSPSSNFKENFFILGIFWQCSMLFDNKLFGFGPNKLETAITPKRFLFR